MYVRPTEDSLVEQLNLEEIPWEILRYMVI